ncbi:IS3 family transposase [Cohnella faecalis]|uniref:IS3 family transposase n=1 Tax=Cohnella faecalis TaxID=2315694 RepID=UPI002277A113|nr:IS3 family transposase [Cohnella faecalis]
METFFGHMKDELNYKDCKSHKELRLRVNEYMTYPLKKMTPDEYRSHLLAALRLW